uniref:Uncharacterized protein n=1 Tax=Ditylenchus dipsaci TaxID=166011 RepID=A0A915CXX4_9BILA
MNEMRSVLVILLLCAMCITLCSTQSCGGIVNSCPEGYRCVKVPAQVFNPQGICVGIADMETMNDSVLDGLLSVLHPQCTVPLNEENQMIDDDLIEEDDENDNKADFHKFITLVGTLLQLHKERA